MVTFCSLCLYSSTVSLKYSVCSYFSREYIISLDSVKHHLKYFSLLFHWYCQYGCPLYFSKIYSLNTKKIYCIGIHHAHVFSITILRYFILHSQLLHFILYQFYSISLICSVSHHITGSNNNTFLVGFINSE